MTDRLTCCPHCNTSFRITDEQLHTARGSVRCGSCLRVFKALEHLIETKPVNDTDSTTSDAIENQAAESDLENNSDQKSERDKLSLENPDSEDFLLADDPDSDNDPLFELEDGEEGDLSELDQELEKMLGDDNFDRIEDTQRFALGQLSDSFSPRGDFGDRKSPLFDRQYKVSNSDKNHRHNTDESWAVNLLNEEADAEENNQKSDSAQLLLNDNENFVGKFYSDLESPELHSNASYIRLPAVPETLSYQPDSSDEADHLDDSPTRSHELPAEDDTREPALDNSQDNIKHVDEQPEYLSAHEPEFEIAPDDDPFYITDEEKQPDTQQLLSTIPAAPVEMEWRRSQNSWIKKLLWSSLILISGLALGAQYAWYHIDKLGLKEPWREGYQLLCPYLNCNIPPLLAPEKIKATNLVVRSHPRAESALIIDSVLLNTAPFAQPFPDLSLAFSDIKGKVLAQRRFTPAEYLKGEMAGLTLMPSSQPVHITLEIVDPGEEAVNYTATIPLQ